MSFRESFRIVRELLFISLDETVIYDQELKRLIFSLLYYEHRFQTIEISFEILSKITRTIFTGSLRIFLRPSYS